MPFLASTSKKIVLRIWLNVVGSVPFFPSLFCNDCALDKQFMEFFCNSQMVTAFGMSEIGPWALMDPVVRSSDVVLRMMARNSMSEKLLEDIDKAVKSITDKAYDMAKSHIRNNRAAMDKIVEVLLEKETLSGDEFQALLSEFREIPVDNKDVKAAPVLAST